MAPGRGSSRYRSKSVGNIYEIHAFEEYVNHSLVFVAFHAPEQTDHGNSEIGLTLGYAYSGGTFLSCSSIDQSSGFNSG